MVIRILAHNRHNSRRYLKMILSAATYDTPYKYQIVKVRIRWILLYKRIYDLICFQGAEVVQEQDGRSNKAGGRVHQQAR